MAKPNSEYQRAHRERRATERQAMIAALHDGIRRLGNTDDSWHNGFRDMLRSALPGATLKTLGEGK